MAYTLLNLVEDVLNEAYKRENLLALSHIEIWKKAEEYGINKKLETTGKTPWNSIAAQLYVNIRDNENSLFIKIKGHPTRFALKQFVTNAEIPSKKMVETVKKIEASYNERDLHPLLTKFVYSNNHFHCFTKTIFHETSTKHKKGQNHWLHPDLIAVYFPFDSYQTGTLDIIKSFYESKMKLFSFEMKKDITYSSLRECFFQAVSNSSWANEGYLVALNFDEDNELFEEMQRLNNSFGIGFIQLNSEFIEQSKIIIPARSKEQIDWDALDRLIEENPDVKQFVDSVNEDVSLQKVKNKSEYDEIFDDVKMSKWIKEKGIH